MNVFVIKQRIKNEKRRDKSYNLRNQASKQKVQKFKQR